MGISGMNEAMTLFTLGIELDADIGTTIALTVFWFVALGICTVAIWAVLCWWAEGRRK